MALYHGILPSLIILAIGCSTSNFKKPALDHIQVPEGYEVELVAGPDLVDYPMFATLDQTGRLFVFESIGNVYETSQQAIDTPQFRIKLLIDRNQDGFYDNSTVFADSLSFPQGGVFMDGSLIASSAPDLLKLTDIDGDGVADEKEVLLSGFTLNVNANSLIGPFQGPDGWLYLTSAIEGFDVLTREGERLKGETARIWRVRPDGTGLQWVSAGGMNNPIELTFTPAGEVLGTQTFFVHPQRGLRDALTYWIDGGIYGKESSVIDRDSLSRTGEVLPVISQYSRVAPSGIGIYRNTILGESFSNNLFSAQFNTHQVVRHKLSRSGASFKMDDEIFFKSSNTDFHPTDVLEDADGSLLVVETGGWFILGCPLSQVSKPQLKGGIYRVRKSGGPVVDDPYGNEIRWHAEGIASLSEYLSDPRPFVADRAATELVHRSDSAIVELVNVLQTSGSINGRTRAVFALYRINTPQSIAAITFGLKDPQLQVKVAAAKAAGLSGKMQFAESLIEMLNSDELAVIRQAATSLGQIGAKIAIPHLINIAEVTTDRMVKHAIIYSLLSFDDPESLRGHLKEASEAAVKVILIALDQMTSNPLQVDDIFPYLNNSDLEETVLWVASHHPEWSTALTIYLRKRLKTEQGDQKPDIYQDLVTGYCSTREMQQYLSDMLSNNRDLQEFALSCMMDCGTDPFPSIWTNSIGSLMNTTSDQSIKMHAVNLIELRGVRSLESQLEKIMLDHNNSAALRIASVRAIAAGRKSLSDLQFKILVSYLSEENSLRVSQQAASTISSTSLNHEQQQHLAGQVLPGLDPFILPRLLPSFEGAEDVAVGRYLIKYLSDLPSLDNFSEEYVNTLVNGYPDELDGPRKELLKKLRQVREQRYQRIAELEQTAIGGSEERGRALYFGKALCSTCHTMKDAGGSLGPDLTAIQKDRSVHDIVEAMVYPSVSFVREYETYKIITDKSEYRGVIQEQTPDAIVLGTGPDTAVRISTKDIQLIEQLDISMMPQGLDQILTEDEFSDLLAYILGRDLVY